MIRTMELKDTKHVRVNVTLKYNVLSDQQGLAVFLDRVEIVGGVHATLVQDAGLQSAQLAEHNMRAARIDRKLEKLCDEGAGPLE